MTSQFHFAPGDIVVLRYVETDASARMVRAIMGDAAGTPGQAPYLVDGRVVTVAARYYRVIVDNDDVVALFQPSDTPLRRWVIEDRVYLPNTGASLGDTLRLLFPGKPYDVTLFFHTKGDQPWYVDAFFEGDGLTRGWRERRKADGTAGYASQKTRQQGAFRGWYVNIQLPFRRMPYGFDIVDQTLDIVVRPDRSWYWKDDDELETAIAAGALSPEDEARIRIAGKEVVALIEGRRAPFDDTWIKATIPDRSPITSFPDGWQAEPAQLAVWPVS